MLRYGGVYHQIISFGPWSPHYGAIGPEFFSSRNRPSPHGYYLPTYRPRFYAI